MVWSTFTIEFSPILTRERCQPTLDKLVGETGVLIKELDTHKFQVICSKSNQIDKVGRLLFHTSMRARCKVVASSGTAATHAGAYKKTAI